MLDDAPANLQALYAEMAPLGLKPLWEELARLVPASPAPASVPHLWSYDPMRALLGKAGGMISAEEAERRVLILENPGLAGQSGVTGTLYAGLQLVLPGEVAPCHRHAPSALRFVMEGGGAYTAVQGERVTMRPFDLVLTPSGLWHDHGNPSEEPIVWLDGLDIPLLLTLDAGYAEKSEHVSFPRSRSDGDTIHRAGRGMRPWTPSAHDEALGEQPLFHYPYEDWSASLDAISADEPHPAHAHKLEFVNPSTGGPVMRTISAFGQRVPTGFTTKPARSTAGTVMVVCEGTGRAVIGDHAYDLAPRDVFIVPSWAPLTLTAETNLTLFGFSDRATQEALGVYREDH